ncbi:cytochrome c oxidase subunit II [Bacillus songklensis]|uniref:Cytochrome c oxidase subunit 2 n=1 Tax=Bacillus songklensis TaxID=1069116 RepID=A0ABV8B3K0_9BACI
MKNWLPKWRVMSLFSMIALLLAGCGKPFLSTLQPAGEVASMQYDLLLLSTAIMVLVIIVVTIIFIYVVVRFRRRKGDENFIPKQVEGSHKLELIWTVIPILLLIILAVPTVAYTFKLADVKEMDAKKSDALVINVRSNAYWWEFEYPNQKIITSQDLVVPTDQKVYFKLKASDVKHSFWIPAVGGKMDTNTEGENKFWLVFDSKKAEEVDDVFYGKCAELCGPSHALMDFKVKALPKDEFDAWVKDMKAAKPEVADADAKAGEEVFKQSCIGCHAVEAQDQRPEQARQAPNLAGFADRERVAGVLEHNEENIKAWIKDPEAIKPGNKMTGTYKVSDEQIDQLAKYLESLKLQ